MHRSLRFKYPSFSLEFWPPCCQCVRVCDIESMRWPLGARPVRTPHYLPFFIGSLSHRFCSHIIRRLRLCLHLCMHSSPCFASEASQLFTWTFLHVRGDFSNYSALFIIPAAACVFCSLISIAGFEKLFFFYPHILPFPYNQETTWGLISTVWRWPQLLGFTAGIVGNNLPFENLSCWYLYSLTYLILFVLPTEFSAAGLWDANF
jgi:hypothetical protein